jgi:phosphonate transport system substrate-binding protein
MLLTACDSPPADKPLQYSIAPAQKLKITYRLAVHPLHNPQKLCAAYQPLVNHLNNQLHDAHIELEASRDYQAYEQKFRNREAELLLPNPWQTIQAIKVGYHVIAMAGDAEDFKGIFIVREDSGIKEPADIKGKVVSYPSPTALAAAIMPQYYLHMKGININRDIQNVYVGSQESSIMNVYLGKSAVGATWPPPWRSFKKDHPAEAAKLKVIWETPSLINNSVMVRDDIPINIRKQIQDALINLEKTSQGKAILNDMETANMYMANDASYDVVRDYIKHFEQEVRPVESK